jgi:holdfast attachment protein HfaA
MAEVSIFRSAAAAAGALMTLSLAGAAAAQTLEANVSSYNAGWGRVAGQENQPVAAGTRDANGNRVIIDGIMQTGVDESSFSRSDGGSWGSSGVGSQSGNSTAIGNNLVVITQGSWNTVIVDSHQTNNGNISADTSLNGGVSNVP